jgi:hypothetical protein
MKKRLAMTLFILLGSVSVYGSQSRRDYRSQFNIPKATKQNRARAEARETINPKNFAATSHHPQEQAKASSKALAPRANATRSSVSTLGFVSATQIPAGGAAYNQGYTGEFNGGGKEGVLTIVQNYVNNDYVYSISAVLGNGDGTFKAPVLTTVLTQDPLLVADVNGDGKDDIIQVHAGNTPSTFDVWLSNGDGTFSPGESYQVSPTTLQGGLMTDVDGDGKMDMLAIDSQTPGLVCTLRGNGDGTFQAATSVTMPNQAPTDLVFADFNGDGKPDFAGIATTGQVVIYLQEEGNFVLTGSPLTTPDSNYGICGLSAGDLTGDGKADVVTVNCEDGNDNKISVYVNVGDGIFATGVYYAEAASGGASPTNVYAQASTIVDVNGDGKADIVLSNSDGGDVTILLGNGDGTVNVPNVGYATGGYPQFPALVADFDGDGLADIMVINDNYSYAYLRGYGDGTFRAGLDYYAPISDDGWPEAVTIATGDFNDDGIKDFAVGNCCSSSTGMTIFLSRGDGSLRPGVNYGAGGALEFVAVADFDNDGNLDVAATVWDTGSLQIFHGNGDGTFTVGSSYSTGGEGSCTGGLVTSDFNHDQHIDIAVVNEGCGEGGNNVAVLLNDGTGGFLSAVTYPVSNLVWQIAAGDVNGDGYPDLLLPLRNSSQVAVLLANNDNSGTFRAETDVNLVNGGTTYFEPEFITLGDFNGDGKLDFAVSIDDREGTEQGIVVALGKGDGTFETPSLYSSTQQNYLNFDWPYPAFLQSADINGDGILDLVYTNSNYSTVGVLLGNGDGTFGTPSEYPAGGDAFGIAVADINGDGALDVVTANEYSDAVTVLLNANGNTETPNYSFTTNTISNTVNAGSSGAYNLVVTGRNGYAGTVTFMCRGLPAGAACSFGPASVATAGNVPQPTVLTISTTGSTTAFLFPVTFPDLNSGAWAILASLGGLGLFGFVIVASQKPNRRQTSIALSLLLMATTLELVGCSEISRTASTPPPPVTPAGTYAVTVTSTGTGANTPTHFLNVTLVIQ